jgi:hypothetical protein
VTAEIKCVSRLLTSCSGYAAEYTPLASRLVMPSKQRERDYGSDRSLVPHLEVRAVTGQPQSRGSLLKVKRTWLPRARPPFWGSSQGRTRRGELSIGRARKTQRRPQEELPPGRKEVRAAAPDFRCTSYPRLPEGKPADWRGGCEGLEG